MSSFLDPLGGLAWNCSENLLLSHYFWHKFVSTSSVLTTNIRVAVGNLTVCASVVFAIAALVLGICMQAISVLIVGLCGSAS